LSSINALKVTYAASTALEPRRANRVLTDVEASAPRTHRAEADARHLATLWCTLTKVAAKKRNT